MNKNLSKESNDMLGRKKSFKGKRSAVALLALAGALLATDSRADVEDHITFGSYAGFIPTQGTDTVSFYVADSSGNAISTPFSEYSQITFDTLGPRGTVKETYTLTSADFSPTGVATLTGLQPTVFGYSFSATALNGTVYDSLNSTLVSGMPGQQIGQSVVMAQTGDQDLNRAEYTSLSGNPNMFIVTTQHSPASGAPLPGVLTTIAITGAVGAYLKKRKAMDKQRSE